jgi:hypothetical protein
MILDCPCGERHDFTLGEVGSATTIEVRCAACGRIIARKKVDQAGRMIARAFASVVLDPKGELL